MKLLVQYLAVGAAGSLGAMLRLAVAIVLRPVVRHRLSRSARW